ncbi:hypothetical protein [Cryptosporangium aurantiacum]|uniref:Uncharacterized protein n=1 Tax=Cryptosporangium aurantiacum TaxID=134849 RepID=A0A1M7RQ29_9ACTN|nr:hypothetical protein [Cryptosporangium aurantiacum]SHN48206.1 hypothetical protein SAMN05443668_13624 [Cryptosporangium aurantiacum]
MPATAGPRAGRSAVFLLALVLAIVSAGCVGCESLDDQAAKLPVRDHVVALDQVWTLGLEVQRQAGAPPTDPKGYPLGLSIQQWGCYGGWLGDQPLPGAYEVWGSADVALPLAQHRSTLTRMRDRWVADGWADVKYGPLGTLGAVELRGSSSDGHGVSVVTNANGLSVEVRTDCFRDVDPDYEPS